MPAKPKKAAASRDITLLYRYSEVADTGADEQARTLQVAFSSEFPGDQRANKRDVELGAAAKIGEPYVEVLSHAPGDFNLDLLNNDGALLDEHDDQAQLGKVRHAEVSDDKMGRAVVEFDGETELSKVRFNQMRKRSRPHISHGYTHTRYLGDTALPDGRTAKRFAWASVEISSVAVPMDPTVGSKRSAADAGEMFHCTRCADLFAREDLDADFRCDNCGPVARSLKDRVIRAGKKDVSAFELAGQVEQAARQDERFTGKDNKGNPTGWVSIRDLTHDGENWSAIIYASVDGKTYQVALEVKGGNVKLGEHQEVAHKDNWVPVTDSTRAHDAGHTRSAAPNEPITNIWEVSGVDSVDFSNADAIAKKLNPDTKMKLRSLLLLDTADPNRSGGAAPDEKKIRADLTVELTPEITRTVRASIADEQKKTGEKVATRNQEITSLADEAVKTYGKRWNGKPGEVYVVGERIRALENRVCGLPADHDSTEARRDFKRSLEELITGSREPKEQTDAAALPDEIASRCSLRAIYNAAARSKERTPCFMPKDGAEREAHDEIYNRAKEFPGGVECLGEGVHLPINTPSSIRRNGHPDRFTRDALATDFVTAGALIAPQFVLPYIELLRNKPALSRAGMTILSGVMGNLILPRQEAPTTGQSVAEGAALAYYDQVLGQIKMSPHRVGSAQKYSRLALLQSTPDFEAMVLNDHMSVIGLYIDEMGINGQGAGDQPLGILNQLGIASVIFAGSAANAYANSVKLETAIRKANIDDPISFITTSTSRGTLRSTARLLTGATTVATEPVWEDGEMLVGRPAWDSQQIPGDVLVAGAFRHLVLAQWGGLAVILDTLTLAEQDKYRLVINTYIDFALRHAQAIARSADSLAALA